MDRRTWLVGSAGALLLARPWAAPAPQASEAAPAASGADWPRRPITFVVPSSAGGGTDAFARMLGQALGERLGRPIVIDNRAGASGNIGAEAVARAAADGHTFLLAASAAVVINPALVDKLGFSIERDLTPVAQGVASPYVLLAQPALGVASLPELLARARRDPGQLTFGSAGTGTVPYLAVRMLEEASGARFTHVPYKGLAPVFHDLVGGRLDFVFTDLASAAPHLARLQPLAVTEALPGLPGVPTLAQAGLGAVRADNHFSLLAPAGTPPAVVARMSAAVNEALRRPDVAAKLQRLGLVPVFDTPDQYAAALKTQRADWAAFIRRAGIKPGD